jgi:alpha-N-arabinofuranosidase
LFFSATRDRKSGTIFLKVVNARGAAQQIQVQITGVQNISFEGEAISLSADSLIDTNSMEQPQRVVPRSARVGNLSENFTRELPPYSITVLKLKPS